MLNYFLAFHTMREKQTGTSRNKKENEDFENEMLEKEKYKTGKKKESGIQKRGEKVLHTKYRHDIIGKKMKTNT